MKHNPRTGWHVFSSYKWIPCGCRTVVSLTELRSSRSDNINFTVESSRRKRVLKLNTAKNKQLNERAEHIAVAYNVNKKWIWLICHLFLY